MQWWLPLDDILGLQLRLRDLREGLRRSTTTYHTPYTLSNPFTQLSTDSVGHRRNRVGLADSGDKSLEPHD